MKPAPHLLQKSGTASLRPRAAVADGPAHRRSGPPVNGKVTGRQGHQKSNDHLQHNCRRHNAVSLQIGAHKIGNKRSQPITSHRAQRHSNQQGDQPINNNQQNVHEGNLRAARSHQLHHPNLA